MAEVLRTEEGAPEGWTKIVKIRLHGATAGALDIYMLSPGGRLLRSKPDVENYLFREGISDVPIGEFDFSKTSVLNDPVFVQALAQLKEIYPEIAVPADPSKVPSRSAPLLPPTSSKRGRKPKVKEEAAEGKPPQKRKYVKKEKSFRGAETDAFTPASPQKLAQRFDTKCKSPYDLLLENFVENDWKFMTAAFFFEHHGCREPLNLRRYLNDLFDTFPSAQDLVDVGWTSFRGFLARLGYSDETNDQLARRIFDYSAGHASSFESMDSVPVTSLVSNLYGLYVRRETLESGEVLDYASALFNDWLKARHLAQRVFIRNEREF